MRYQPISRRDLFKRTGIVVVGASFLTLQSCDAATDHSPLNLYLAIEDQHLTFILPRSEMGQDVVTTFAMLIAEELEAPLDLIRVTLADASPEIPDRMTVGSSSVRNWWQRMRQTGANTKQLLIRQAALRAERNANELYADKGYILSQNQDIRLSYGELLREIKVPVDIDNAPLKPGKSFRLLGHNHSSLMNREKVTGTYQYLDDIPVSGEHLKIMSVVYKKDWPFPSINRLKALKAGFGLTAAIGLHERVGRYTFLVFLCHEKNWPLLQAKRLLENEKHQQLKANGQAGISAFETQCKKAVAQQVIDAQGFTLAFKTPALPHAPMEPPGARLKYRPDRVEVWAPTQAPDQAQAAIAKRLQLKTEQVTLHTLAMGGAFGRKRYTDYLLELALAAKALYDLQIEATLTLVWTREDELSREHYRPATLQQVNWSVAKPEYLALLVTEAHAGAKPAPPKKIATGFPLGLALQSQKSTLNHHFSSGIWRAVHHGYHAFALCSAVDELCRQTGRDPIEYYLTHPSTASPLQRAKQLLKGQTSASQRLSNLVQKVAEMAGWTPDTPGLGFAAYSLFGSHIALIAQVSIDSQDKLRVKRLWAAVDCGFAIHPDKIKAQIEGGLLYALSACLFGTMPEDKDRRHLNFDQLPVLRIPDAPDIDITIATNDASPTGVGELGVPALAPAVCNALRTLTNRRFTELPLINAGKINYDNALPARGAEIV